MMINNDDNFKMVMKSVRMDVDGLTYNLLY